MPHPRQGIFLLVQKEFRKTKRPEQLIEAEPPGWGGQGWAGSCPSPVGQPGSGHLTLAPQSVPCPLPAQAGMCSQEEHTQGGHTALCWG